MNNLLHMNDTITTQIDYSKDITPIITSNQSSYDIFIILRVIFYVIFIIKIVEISFIRKKKFSLKERIYRKFIFSYQQIMRYFTEEDKSMMETTLANTMKNASIEYDPRNSKIRKTFKKVSFETDRNKYYDPKTWKQQQSILSAIKSKPIADIVQQDTFQDQKIHDQFIERGDLLDLNEKQDQMLPLNSDLTEKNQEIESTFIKINEQVKKESNYSNPLTTHEQYEVVD